MQCFTAYYRPTSSTVSSEASSQTRADLAQKPKQERHIWLLGSCRDRLTCCRLAESGVRLPARSSCCCCWWKTTITRHACTTTKTTTGPVCAGSGDWHWQRLVFNVVCCFSILHMSPITHSPEFLLWSRNIIQGLSRNADINFQRLNVDIRIHSAYLPVVNNLWL